VRLLLHFMKTLTGSIWWIEVRLKRMRTAKLTITISNKGGLEVEV
jgi:hypothetical protein